MIEEGQRALPTLELNWRERTLPQTAPVIRFDRHSLIIDDQPTLIRSGAMHYFRLPGRDLWHDRLYKLKAAGYNTVDLYFNWGFHSPEPGIYDFSGVRDLVELLAITRELGLYVIARPGPYINAETSGGGFPGWLLARRDLPLRNRVAGNFVWSDEYMGFVREWWTHLLPLINASPNVILLQIENEYATPEMEPDTIQSLYALARELGVHVPLFHNDLYIAGLYEDLVDIYAFDNYPITQFTQDWRGTQETFQVIDQLEETMRDYCMDRPLMVAELQAGWYGGWKGERYETIRQSLGREQIGLITKSVLGQGLTIFNHYMAIGGTNWNHLGSTEVYTSYDFAAPIAENGLNTERLFAAKALNQLLESFAEHWVATDRLEACPVDLSDDHSFYTARRPKNQTQAAWLFFRNLSKHTKNSRINNRFDVVTQSDEMLVLPWQMPLAGGAQVDFSTNELVWQNRQLLVVKADRPTTIVLSQLDNIIEASAEAPLIVKLLAADQVELHYPELEANGFIRHRLGDLTLIFLGANLVDTLWIEPDGSLLMGPQMRLPQGFAYLPGTEKVLRLSPDGETLETMELSANKTIPLAKLSPAHFWLESPRYQGQEIEAEKFCFHPVSAEGADFDANQLYEGSAWYRLRLSPGSLPQDKASSLSITARHHWAAYLNGQWLGHGEHILLHPGQEIPASVNLLLPEVQPQSGADPELLFFVTGLGHPKGFHDDARRPQGIIHLALNGQECTNLLEIYPYIYSQRSLNGQQEGKQRVSNAAYGRVSIEPGKTLDGPDGPVLHMETSFHLNRPPGVVCPWSLVLKSAEYERIDFWLNGVLIGKDWLAGRRQERFYLPESLLQEGENSLSLILMNFSKPITSAYLLAHRPVITIEPDAVLGLF
jgi:hypothetical protein